MKIDSRTRILLYFGAAAAILIIGIVTRLPQLKDASSLTEQSGPAIGGELELIDTKGNVITEKALLGVYTLVNFGYTFCPDVCPTGLQTAADALDLLPEYKVNKVISWFVTIDPERDTPDVMGEYVKHFHPSLVGLTGSPEQIKKAASAFKVYYKKVVEEGSPAEDYLMDHSAVQYLMGPDGKFITHFPHGITPEEMAKKLDKNIK